MCASIPIHIEGTSPLTGGGLFAIRILMSAPVARSLPIQFGCSRPDVVRAAMSAWPITILIPTGHAAIMVPLTANRVAEPTSVQLYAAPMGVDRADHEQWSALETMQILP